MEQQLFQLNQTLYDNLKKKDAEILKITEDNEYLRKKVKHLNTIIDELEEEKQEPKQEPIPSNYKTKICENYLKAQCSNQKCTFAHGIQELRPRDNLQYGIHKYKMCSSVINGINCRFGTKCRYAHDKRELYSNKDLLNDVKKVSDSILNSFIGR